MSDLEVEGLRLAFAKWHSTLPIVKSRERLPARGSIAACLQVLERLKSEYSLDIRSHLAKGGAQIKGLSRASVSRILASHGEYRPFLGVGGRTNRGSPAAAESMLEWLKLLHLESKTKEERNRALNAVQHLLVEKVQEYHNRQRLRFAYNASHSTASVITEILQDAIRCGKSGPCAQHLVGAKLELRFPTLEISNHAASAADASTGRTGDFLVGDTVFHVTVTPVPSLFEKCQSNLSEGKSPFVVVPTKKLWVARELAE